MLKLSKNRELKNTFGFKWAKVSGLGENYIIKNFMVCAILHQIFYGKIKKNEISGACSTYGGEERCIQDFGGEFRGKETTCKT